MSDAPVLIAREGHIAFVTINRPQKKNAFDAATIATTTQAARRLMRAPRC